MRFQSHRQIGLNDLLKEKIGCSATKVKKMIAHSEIYINGELNTKHSPTVPKGAVIEISKTKRLPKEDIAILYEDQDMIAVEKPPGILSIQSTHDQDRTLFGKVNQYLKKKSHNRERAFIVHRLDQKVSGVIVFAKSESAKTFLTDNWPKFEKTYHAAVQGSPNDKTATLESWLFEDKNYKVHSGEKRPDSKLAVTHYKIEKKFRNFSLLSVTLGTGKKNQIRVQLADIGCSIIGDFKYGATSNPIGRIGLHAHTLSLIQPTSKKKLALHSPTPRSFFKL